jgi:predicted Rossmann fold flavoprotein
MRTREKTKSRKFNELIVVGGGAAGLMAAVAAARRGVRPLILERMDRVGKKLLATGNGRCNLTNLNAGASSFHGADAAFVKPAIDRLGVQDTLAFFENLGLTWKEEDGGRVFPATDQASTVLDLLRYELKRLQIEEACGSEVTSIERTAEEFRLNLKNSHVHFCRRLILAAGGKAAPSLGSNGSGYRLAQGLGHRIVEPMPSIVQLRLMSPHLKRLKGVRINVRAALVHSGAASAETDGELLFTDYGVTGPVALKLSRKVNECMGTGVQKLLLKVDLFPEMPESRFLPFLEERFRQLHYKDAQDGLVGLIHKRLIPVTLELALIDKTKPAKALVPSEIERLGAVLKAWSIEVIGTRSWLDAQISAGGVASEDVDPETLESRRAPGLFFAGEILDVDGDSGGFNLQWAWSSGWTAGTHAASAAGDRR